MRRLVSSLAVLVLLFAAAVTAWAGDLLAAKGTLGAALTARIAAIGVPPKKSPLAKELKHLKKASTALNRFAGTLDAKGIIALVSCGRSIVKSQTGDPQIAGETSVMLGCVIDALTVQEAELIQDATEMFAPADQIKFQGLLDSARASVAEAETIGAGNAAGAFGKIEEAFATYVKAGKMVQKVLDRQLNQNLPIIRQGTLRVQNRNGQLLRVEAIEFDLFYLPSMGDAVRVQEAWQDHNAAAGAPDLPYKIPDFVVGDPSTEFDMYPTLYEAVRSAIGMTPDGSVKGVIRFTSNKHGKVLIPVDMFLFVP